jgi:serine/threonine protein kinase
MLGKGNTATVYEIRDMETRYFYAGKVVMKRDEKNQKVEYDFNERDRLKSLSHPHVVKLHEFIDDKKCWLLVIDLCSNGSLADMLKNRGTLTEPEIRYFAYQILVTVKFLLGSFVIH